MGGRTLAAHTSCVNALAFSGDARWLASAGDGESCVLRLVSGGRESGGAHAWHAAVDPHVYLWDFHREPGAGGAAGRFVGPRVSRFMSESQKGVRSGCVCVCVGERLRARVLRGGPAPLLVRPPCLPACISKRECGCGRID